METIISLCLIFANQPLIPNERIENTPVHVDKIKEPRIEEPRIDPLRPE